MSSIPKKKVIILGDEQTGKSSVKFALTLSTTDEELESSSNKLPDCDCLSSQIEEDGNLIELEFYEVHANFKKLDDIVESKKSPQADTTLFNVASAVLNSQVDLVIYVFSVIDRHSLDHAQNIIKTYKRVPILFVGTKQDLRFFTLEKPQTPLIDLNIKKKSLKKRIGLFLKSLAVDAKVLTLENADYAVTRAEYSEIPHDIPEDEDEEVSVSVSNFSQIIQDIALHDIKVPEPHISQLFPNGSLLTEEVLTHIFSFLDEYSLAMCSMVNKSCYNAAEDDLLWKKKFMLVREHTKGVAPQGRNYKMILKTMLDNNAIYLEDAFMEIEKICRTPKRKHKSLHDYIECCVFDLANVKLVHRVMLGLIRKTEKKSK